MLLDEFKTELFADYFQFYLQDEALCHKLSEPLIQDIWTEEAIGRLLDISHGAIHIMTARNMEVPVTIKVYSNAPHLKIEENTTHLVNECNLNMTSDNLVVAGCTDYLPDAPRVKIGKGTFRVRIYYNDLDKISEDGLDGDDSYEIHLWPSKEKLEIRTIRYL